MRSTITAAFIATLTSWSMSLWAQAINNTPAASTGPTTYQSVFSSYAPFKDEAVGDWRKLNADVAEGAMPAMQEAPNALSAPAKTQAITSKPVAMDHTRHGGKAP